MVTLLDEFSFRDRCVIGLHDVVSNFVDKPVLPFGVSFLVVVKDVDDVVGVCVDSIKEFASQVVLVEGDKDCSPSWRGFVCDLNNGLELCKYRWVFKWDGDMFALDGFGEWLDRLKSLDENFFYEVDVGRVCASRRLWFGGFEGRLFTQHPSLRYRWVPDRDSLVFPLWFRLLRWREKFIFHLNPK